jgi:hypothetical protein
VPGTSLVNLLLNRGTPPASTTAGGVFFVCQMIVVGGMVQVQSGVHKIDRCQGGSGARHLTCQLIAE